MDKVSLYIKENWRKTFHPAGDLSGEIKIDHPYVSPCTADHYTDLFYWDTYFINIGLLADGFTEQARNNIDNISRFIDALGFMPNVNYISDRSQPPDLRLLRSYGRPVGYRRLYRGGAEGIYLLADEAEK